MIKKVHGLRSAVGKKKEAMRAAFGKKKGGFGHSGCGGERRGGAQKHIRIAPGSNVPI